MTAFTPTYALVFVKNAYDALDGADALAICTEWDEFRSPDFDRMKELLKQPVLADGRNLYDPEFMTSQGSATMVWGGL